MNFEESRRIFTTGDARKLARKRLPRLVFDFIDGAAGREIAAVKNASKIDPLRIVARKASSCLRFTVAALLTPGDIIFQLFPPQSIHFL